MGFFVLVFLALGLAMDAFAVSVTNGMCYRHLGKKQAVATSVTFGVFQAGMTAIGYFAGRFMSEAIARFDHWIALILLGAIGGSMLFEAVREIRHPHLCDPNKDFSLRVLLIQGVATSIDALAVGIGLAVLQTDIWQAAALIGLITLLVSYLGCLLGKKFGEWLGSSAKILGGFILIIIGVKIFLEHMLGS